MPDEHMLQPHPFTTEDEYWALVLARLEVRYWLQRFRTQRARLLTKALGQETRTTALHAQQTALETQYGSLLDAYRARVACTPPHYPAPRMLRLAARLTLTEAECDVLHYLILTVCESAFSGTTTSHHREVGHLADFLGIDPVVFFALLDPHGPLLRYDLLHIDSHPSENPRRRDVSMELSLVKALRGMPLTAAECQTLGESALRDVLLEEPALTFLQALPEALDTAQHATAGPSGLPATHRTAASPQASESRTELVASRDRVAAEEQQPYTNDLAYLEDHLTWFKARCKWKQLLEKSDDAADYDCYAENYPYRIREAQVQERIWRHRIERRLLHTLAAGTWLPRAEQLATMRQLTPFEKHVLLFLTGVTISSPFQRAVRLTNSAEVGTLLHLFWDTLPEQIAARKFFHREAPLLQDALIDLATTPFKGDLACSDVRIDRRMVDYLVGLETEATALVEDSHLYRPTVNLDRVILPAAQKRLIVETVTGFPAFQQARQRYFDTLIEYGRGLVLLFWGPSGSGKTAMANALANHLGKRLLLINYPRIGQMSSDQVLKLLFREAKIHDAVLFFDECDGIFESRERHNAEIGLILSEIERFDGLIIMATNRPAVLDEAMHRRITLAVEFRLPDAAQRADIWRAHLPPALPCVEPLDLMELASRYELSGGLIKNAVLAALSLATARHPEAPCLRHEDLEQGARLQMRSQLRLAAFEECTIPQSGLDTLIVPATMRQALLDLIGLTRVRTTLINEWGFTEAAERNLGATALFYGPPGTGKSLAAEAVAYELGRPLRRVNMAQITSKWVGETAQNLEALFREARQHEAVLVFEEADALFAGRTPVGSATDRYANLDTAVLLREIERFPGVVILTSNLVDNIDDAFQRRLRLTLAFPTPDRDAREALWRRHFPARMPLASDISCAALAAFPLTGAQIRNAVLKAATSAALRSEVQRCVTQADLVAAAEEETRVSSASKVVGFISKHGV
jgi:SpoVK/Ycf46/Vps4 family AAA+-type ATPase